MTEVNVKKLSCLVLHHKVTRVSVPDAKCVGCDTLPRKGPNEILMIVCKTPFYFFLSLGHSEKFARGHLGHKVVHNAVLTKRA